METYLTTSEAAARLGVNASRVRQLCLSGRLKGATKLGRDWLIPESVVAAGVELKPAGRPRRKE